MKILCLGYYQQGDPLLAASFYLGLWNRQQQNNLQQLFIKASNQEEAGQFLSLGEDRTGNEVLVVGCQGQVPIVSRLLRGLQRIGRTDTETLLIDTTSINDSVIKTGAKLAQYGWRQLGWRVVELGIKYKMSEIEKVATTIKERTKQLE
ncbi:DUF3189 family protein [Halanaerobaculum tunisiense]